MIDVYINDSKVGIDKAAAISLNLINFDIKDISNRVLNYTNDFKIPVAGNELTFEFSSGINVTGDFPYTDFAVKIIADGIAVVDSGRGWITSISDGYYNITVTDKSGAIQDMKDFSLGQKADYSSSSVQALINSTSGYKLDFLYNQYQVDYATLNADNYRSNWKQSNLSVYIKYVFDLFATSSGYSFSGSLWIDTEFLKLRTVVYSHGRYGLTSTGPTTIDNPIINPSESFYTLFKEVLKVFCSTFRIEGKVIYIERFDSLDWDSPVDWSGKVTGNVNKGFNISGTGVNNYLRYRAESDTNKTSNQVNIPCNNENLIHEQELIKINASVFPFVLASQYHTLITANAKALFLPDKESSFYTSGINLFITTTKSIDKFIFITDGSYSFSAGVVVTEDFYYGIPPTITESTTAHTLLSGDNRTIATYYNSVNDYVRIAAMLQDTVFYEVELNLSPVDIHAFDPFNIVSIPELGGTFYVNSIKNYLLSSDKNTATVELIKIS